MMQVEDDGIQKGFINFDDKSLENRRMMTAFDPSTHASTNIHDIHVSNIRRAEQNNYNRLI